MYSVVLYQQQATTIANTVIVRPVVCYTISSGSYVNNRHARVYIILPRIPISIRVHTPNSISKFTLLQFQMCLFAHLAHGYIKPTLV